MRWLTDVCSGLGGVGAAVDVCGAEERGEDHGDCLNQFVMGQPVCVNYRFRCMAAIPGTPVTDPGRIYLVDLYAEALAKPDDPKGTCYASQVLSETGSSSLMLLAFVAAALLVVSSLSVVAAAGGTIAYVVPAGTVGNQDFEGALGMDFDVVKPIRYSVRPPAAGVNG